MMHDVKRRNNRDKKFEEYKYSCCYQHQQAKDLDNPCCNKKSIANSFRSRRRLSVKKTSLNENNYKPFHTVSSSIPNTPSNLNSRNIGHHGSSMTMGGGYFAFTQGTTESLIQACLGTGRVSIKNEPKRLSQGLS